MKSSLSFVLLSVLLIGCGKKNTTIQTAVDKRQLRETKIELEPCDGSTPGADKIDANSDGKPEIVRVLKGKKEVCRTVDLNFDGRLDRTSFFDDAGQLRRVESDFDRDGVVDEIVLFKGGVLTEKRRMTIMDGKLDTWEYFENGVLARTERDENGDGAIDQWWEYPSRGCPLIHVDADGDGRPDPGASIDYCKETGYTPPPVPGEVAAGSQSSNFGKQGERVEELSNEKSGETATPPETNPPPPETTETKPEETEK